MERIITLSLIWRCGQFHPLATLIPGIGAWMSTTAGLDVVAKIKRPFIASAGN
jgi:hypothetical protein